jgi:type IV pilus assembly protein PilY1
MLWFRGKDIADEDGNTITDESRFEMGDPLHAKPVTVIYGATGLNDDALYAVTNDGVLHAFDPDSNSASELWAFVPRPLTARMRDLYYNAEIADPTDRGYGLDGNIRVLRIDVDSDGIIESGDGDRVYLYFGQRRGGSTYYAFNVTNKNAPVLMWSASYAAQGAGQSWSTPVTARVRIGTTTQDVLIFGGGYDTTQDGANYAEDTVGRGVYMVNAFTGALLWRAGPDNGADLQLTQMKHSIPGDVRVVDLTGDGLADRMYAADLGGRLWRFDIFNGKTVAGELNADGDLERFVEGGMLASLGNAEDSAPRTESNTIRFFYAPDPSLITKPGPSYINIAIGSGHRELPASDTTAVNWMFSVRDYYALTPLRADQYKDDCSGDSGICQELVTEDDLEDLTSTVGASATDAVPVGVGGSRGWRLRLTETGEKVLAEARTFQSNVFFTTYAPVERGVTGDACGITFGLNKLYVVAARDARPAYNYDATVGEATEDRSKELAQGSIAPEVVFIFPTPPGVAATEPPKNCAQIAGCDEDDPSTWPLRPGTAVPPVCLVGLETCGAGMANPPIRTYWRQRGAN